MSPPRAILLMGATATGKTDLAVQLVERFPMEIVSVDSALIYRDMNIGTAKPDAALLARAPHFLIDILDPAQSWSAWAFVEQAQRLIGDIQARGKLPLLVGGTMMYFNALQQGLNDLPMTDPDVREALKQRLLEQGLAVLYEELRRCDPATAQRLEATDTQRILRALEVYRISGARMSDLIKETSQAPGIDFTRLILDVAERSSLHRRIATRFQNMLEQGFEDEVVALRERGDLGPDMPSMRCVGYRQMWQYLDGEIDRQTMLDKAVAATRQLAKRQLTWLRKYDNAIRFDYRDYSLKAVVGQLQNGVLAG